MIGQSGPTGIGIEDAREFIDSRQIELQSSDLYSSFGLFFVSGRSRAERIDEVDTRGVCLAAVEHVASHRSADSAIPSAVDRMASHRSELHRDVLVLQDRLNDV